MPSQIFSKKEAKEKWDLLRIGMSNFKKKKKKDKWEPEGRAEEDITRQSKPPQVALAILVSALIGSQNRARKHQLRK